MDSGPREWKWYSMANLLKTQSLLTSSRFRAPIISLQELKLPLHSLDSISLQYPISGVVTRKVLTGRKEHFTTAKNHTSGGSSKKWVEFLHNIFRYIGANYVRIIFPKNFKGLHTTIINNNQQYNSTLWKLGIEYFYPNFLWFGKSNGEVQNSQR